MTVTTNLEGYLERPYLNESYLAAHQQGNDGMQVNFVIQDFEKPSGMQTQFIIVDPDDDSFNAQQITFNILDFENSNAMELKADSLSHKTHGVYLNNPYLTRSYLAGNICAFMGMQVQFDVEDQTDENGMQTEFNIVDPDDDSFNGQQVTFVIEDDLATGMQMEAAVVDTSGMQMLVTLYNTTNLRILCNFLSRGNPDASGLNAWGNDAGVGINWKANVITDPGPDKNIENLNTDIVEQTWKAASAKSGINLDNDTELTQGIFLDTFAMLNHNLTKAATVQLFGSNDSTFASIGVSRVLTLVDEPNIFHIEENLPTSSFRYWRISIDDPTNANPVEIGTIIFGAADIFSGECMTDQIGLECKDFADLINTEGFTNTANSRTQKKIVDLAFKDLAFKFGNYAILKDIFVTQRTTLKCLWIPTPDINDAEFTSRFAVFAKISKIPKERHNSKGPKEDFASFPLNLDESK